MPNLGLGYAQYFSLSSREKRTLGIGSSQREQQSSTVTFTRQPSDWGGLLGLDSGPPHCGVHFSSQDSPTALQVWFESMLDRRISIGSWFRVSRTQDRYPNWRSNHEVKAQVRSQPGGPHGGSRPPLGIPPRDRPGDHTRLQWSARPDQPNLRIGSSISRIATLKERPDEHQ